MNQTTLGVTGQFYYENISNKASGNYKGGDTKQNNDYHFHQIWCNEGEYKNYPVLAKFAQNAIIVRDNILSSSV